MKDHLDVHDVAFVSCAFGDRRYIEQQHRLKKSITEMYPLCMQYHWTDSLPPGSKSFYDSLYGFKVHAVRYAMEKGADKIMFFDPACVLVKPIDHYQSLVQQYGVLAAQDDNKLNGFCGDEALKFMQLKREQIQDWHLVGGSFYYFDFRFPLSRDIFWDWYDQEHAGMFGSQKQQASGQLQGHRNDEACMALALYSNGSRPLAEDTRYNCQNDEVAIIKKYHFK